MEGGVFCVPRFTQADRGAISAWFKFQATDADRAAIKKEFGFSDRTIKQYQRTGKSGRDIIPSRLVNRDSETFRAKDQRLAETLRALTGSGLTITNAKENTTEEVFKRFANLTSAANEVNRIQDRIKYDKNGDGYIKSKGEKIYVQGVKLVPDGKGGYLVVLQKPASKEPGAAGGGKSYQGRGAQTPTIASVTETEDDPTKYAPGTDF